MCMHAHYAHLITSRGWTYMVGSILYITAAAGHMHADHARLKAIIIIICTRLPSILIQCAYIIWLFTMHDIYSI